jgi:hypothetical protein
VARASALRKNAQRSASISLRASTLLAKAFARHADVHRSAPRAHDVVNAGSEAMRKAKRWVGVVLEAGPEGIAVRPTYDP